MDHRIFIAFKYVDITDTNNWTILIGPSIDSIPFNKADTLVAHFER